MLSFPPSVRLARPSFVAAIIAVSTVMLAMPLLAKAATGVSFCAGGLGPMAVCNQGHPHSITRIQTSNTSGDQSCETEKTGGATSSPLRYPWDCASGVHWGYYDGASGYYAAIYNKTTGNRNMVNKFDYN